MGKIRAIILAATETGGMNDDYFIDKTRHLLPVGEKTLIEYLLDHLKNELINDVSIVIDEKIINYKNQFPCLNSYNEIIKKYPTIKVGLIGQNNLTNVGTYIAVKESLKETELNEDDSILVLFGDLFIDDGFLKDVITYHEKNKNTIKITWGLIKYKNGETGDVIVSGGSPPSEIRIFDEDQIVNIFEHLVEKPIDNDIYLDSGILVISSKAWNRIQDLVKIIHRPSSFGIFSFTNIFKQALALKTIQFEDYGAIELGLKGIVPNDKFWYDVNLPWHIIEINHILIKKFSELWPWDNRKIKDIGTEIVYVPAGEEFFTPNNAFIKGPCVLGKKIILESFSRIEHSYIGDNCVIESNANIHGSRIGQNVYVHHGSIVDECLIGNDTEIFCNCVIIRSIIGKNVMVGNHVRIPCQRLKKLEKDILKDQNVIYFSDTAIIKTERFGAIVGDFCQIGAGTIIHPGRRIGKMTTIHANCQVLNNIRPRQILENIQEG